MNTLLLLCIALTRVFFAWSTSQCSREAPRLPFLLTTLSGVTSFTFMFWSATYMPMISSLYLQIRISNWGLLAISPWMCPTIPQNKAHYLCFPAKTFPKERKKTVNSFFPPFWLKVLAPQHSDLLSYLNQNFSAISNSPTTNFQILPLSYRLLREVLG